MQTMVVEDLDGNGGVFSKKKMFFPESYAEEVDHSNAQKLVDLDQATKTLKSINSRIADLALDRFQAVKMLEFTSNKAASSLIGDAKAVKAIAKAWQIFGASSELVQETVKRVRQVLFDDGLQEFKHIVFVDLELDGNGCYAYDQNPTAWLEMTFVRDDFDPTTAFTLRIPAAGTISFIWKREYIASGYEVLVPNFSESYYNGTKRIACSFKLVDIAKAMKDFVLKKTANELPYGTEYDALATTIGMIVHGPAY